MPRQDPGEPYFRVDSAEGQSIIAADPDGTMVIDVRRDDEWVTGHVAGAIGTHVTSDTFPTSAVILSNCAYAQGVGIEKSGTIIKTHLIGKSRISSTTSPISPTRAG